MAEAFFCEQDIIEVDEAWLSKLKQEAEASPRRRSRLCLHRNHKDLVQEMVIAFCRDSLVRPHRHVGKSESFHVIEGDLAVLLFDEEGKAINKIEMGPRGSGKTFIYRISSSLWHSVVLLSDFAVIHEAAAGPFYPEENNFPAWEPKSDADLRLFLQQSLESLRSKD
ncbi:MAG: WbuC family cupin fold metalloprotein [Candidatus Omnitrophota bacterium]